MGQITTGVDKLLQLLERKGKQSVLQAAAELGVEKEVLEEWVELLESEGLVVVSYSFSKQYVEIKDANVEVAVMDNLKKITSEQDAFRRKIDVALNEIDKETAGFSALKKHYEEVQRSIKDELETVREQMSELDRFDKLKLDLTTGVEQQKKVYQQFSQEYDRAIAQYEEQYKEFTAQILIEEKKIDVVEKKIQDLKKQKEATELLVTSGIDSLKQISSELKTHLKDVFAAEKRLEKVHKDLDDLQTGASRKRDDFLKQLAKQVGEKRESILLHQEELLRSTKERIKIIQNYSTSGRKAYESFNELFLKKIKTMDSFEAVDKERQALINDLESLKKKVDSFTVTGKYAKMRKQIGDIEKVIEDYSKRKKSLLGKISELVDFIKR